MRIAETWLDEADCLGAGAGCDDGGNDALGSDRSSWSSLASNV